jgi:hypothetical protein
VYVYQEIVQLNLPSLTNLTVLSITVRNTHGRCCPPPAHNIYITFTVCSKLWNVYIPFYRKLWEGVKDRPPTANNLARRIVICTDSGHFFIALISYASFGFVQSIATNSH